jgi:3',5'-cyclic AMP phosphodiesterase CpdA
VETRALSVCWFTDFEDGPHGVELEQEGGRRWVPAETVALSRLDGVSRHEARVEGLSPGAAGRYRVRSGEVWSRFHPFRTAPPRGRPVRALLISDLQVKPAAASTARALRAHVARRPVDLVLGAGDLVDRADLREHWFGHPAGLGFFDLLAPREDASLLASAPIYSAPGNHDVRTRRDPRAWDTVTFEEIFSFPLLPRRIQRARERLRRGTEIRSGREAFYSFEFGNLFVVVLFAARKWVPGDHRARTGPTYESPGRYIFEPVHRDSPQYRWLRRELGSAAARRADFRVVVLHHPVFSQGENIEPRFGEPLEYREDYLARDLAPLFSRYGVDLVFNGHDHVHARYRHEGVNYLEASIFGISYPLTRVDAEGAPLPEPHGASTRAWHHVRDGTEFTILDSSGEGTVTSYLVRDGRVVDVLDRWNLRTGATLEPAASGGAEPMTTD